MIKQDDQIVLVFYQDGQISPLFWQDDQDDQAINY
jgi:hypothetical protein